MIKFVSRDFKDIKIGSKQVVKVCQGIDVIWENAKKMTWVTKNFISIYDKELPTPFYLKDVLEGKKILSVKISGFKEIPGTSVDYVYGRSVYFKYSINRVTENQSSKGIEAGTEITVTYK